MPNNIPRYVCLLSLVFIFSYNSFAQCTIKGNVSDSLNAPVPFAIVALMNIKDSTVLKGSLANDSGNYLFTNIKPGNYIIAIEATGYAKEYTSAIKADSGLIMQIPAIHIKTNTKLLNNINIVADKPFMERKPGEMVFNIENSIIATGKNALELLNDLPGVTSNDNGISVMGKTGILLLVDGRPIHTDLLSYLKSIDASQIEKIEVITNPSAKYEASGQAVINIILKRSKNMGLSGELFASAKEGISLGSNESLNINYRTKKWDFFGDFNENIFHNYGTHYINTVFPGREIFYENAPATFQGTVSSGTMGFDFMPDKRQTITFSVDAYLQPETIKSYHNTTMHTALTELDSSIYSPSTRNHTEYQITPSLNYKLKIDSNGQELNALVNYGGPCRTTDLQDNPVSYYNSMGQTLRPSTLNTSNQVQNLYGWYAKLDYTLPLSKQAKLEAGLFNLHTSADFNAQFWNVVQGIPYVDTTKSNRFTFTQNIFAAYFNYSQKLGEKIDFQAGLRIEQTNNNGTQFVHDTSFTRNYLNFFPSGELNWKISKNNSVSLSYTRRIERPDFDQLNPFITVIDPYTYTTGNITLMPTQSDEYELTYIFKQFLSVSLGHDYYYNVIKDLYTQNESTLISYSKPENLNYYTGYNIMINAGIPLRKWWNMVASVNVYHDDYNDIISGQSITLTNNSIALKVLNTFTWNNKWNAELNFSYNSSDLEGFSITHPIYVFDAGIGRRFFNDRLTIKISYSDIFMSNKNISSTVYQDINILDTNYWDDRKVRLGITWKFGKSEYEREENNASKTLGKKKT